MQLGTWFKENGFVLIFVLCLSAVGGLVGGVAVHLLMVP